jgi:hypothetical protein
MKGPTALADVKLQLKQQRAAKAMASTGKVTTVAPRALKPLAGGAPASPTRAKPNKPAPPDGWFMDEKDVVKMFKAKQ